MNTNPRQAVILAGGLGTRLLPYTENYPKPMIEINGKPFLSYIIEYLKDNGLTNILLLTGYKSEKILEYYGNGESLGVSIEYSVGKTDWKTGRRLKRARNKLHNNFLLLYCDNFCPINLKDLFKFHEKHNSQSIVTVYNNKDFSTKNNMQISLNNCVQKYDKFRKSINLNGVDIGFFILQKKMIDDLPPGNYTFETILLPDLIIKKQLNAFRTDHKYYSIGSIERLPQTEKYLSDRKIIFLDRDGVINRKAPKAEYINNWSDFEFMDDAVDSLKLLSESGFEIYIITNQAGISRGKTKLDSLKKIHENMLLTLSNHGISITDVYFCPHGWNDNCECRKPKSGMLFQASYEHYFNLTDSILIGDDVRDISAGEGANCKKCFLVDSENSLLSIVQKIIA